MRKTRFIYWYLPAIVWGSLLIVLTSLPKLTPPSLGFKMEDKVYHLAFYVIFGFLWARAVIQGRIEKLQSGLLRSGLFASIFAGLDELHQLFIPGRQCDFGDALADISGVVMALFLFKILFNRYLSIKNL
jgi:VanZ family protein